MREKTYTHFLRMKEKLKEALKTKYKTLGFADKTFESVAAILEATVKEESEIETAIAGVEPLLKAFQGEVDKVRTEKSKKDTELAELKAKIEKLSKKDDEGGNEPRDDEKDKGKPGDGSGKSNPENAALLAAITALTAKVDGMQAEKVTTSRKGKLLEALKDARPATRLAYEDRDLSTFQTDEAFTEWIDKVSGAVKTENEDLAKQGVVYTPPAGGAKVQTNEKVKEATPEETQELLKAMGLSRTAPKI